jgi:hypothetical protein
LGASAVIFVVSLIVSRYVRSHEEEVLPEEQPEPQDTQA